MTLTCSSEAVAKGLCNTCYQRNRRANPTALIRIPVDGELAMAAAAANMTPREFIAAAVVKALDAQNKRRGVA